MKEAIKLKRKKQYHESIKYNAQEECSCTKNFNKAIKSKIKIANMKDYGKTIKSCLKIAKTKRA
jgi:hypothetical protein